ncbi:bifunctional GTP diphosphokinase/guanosine-3',5'-bis pyrophosphate 3'-pyrophosphohydrolase [Parendozoicomonas haliclonae]|uniref:guanosine-3',5'-bis(diphosphate) 3'-diphosphatase n=1 Tax=Parendozoicomonas haliclonae TaxID=1960125 RepID=A0A1X7AQC2_9GAMM|nr:bifunctional GTP diphosphokinase/guanosine-3',5'-bis pyrophosphate 3'-pyrophosphohydrolase [Parendozoicomonas haliclonae]SMA50298.1 Bifunctional (p)ppGpp synthase/hydrolase SpoT [Parendozoicomonas haliclonae]
MSTINDLAWRLKAYLNEDQINQVRRAYYYAEQAHDGQMRRSGEPYITHPLAVAGILADMHMDHQALMAAMLHDVIEDTGIPKSALQKQFGETVAEIVDGVSKLTHVEYEDKTLAQADNFQKMALAMARDIRVILVKLADRLHNLRTLGVMRPEKRRRIAQETLDIYTPLAQRLGMHNIRIEMEDLCFHAMHPMRSSMLNKAVRKARGNRREIVSSVVESINNRLETEGLKGRVMGREKHLFSIYSKMKDQSKSFSEIMDVYGVRIIVENVDCCYRTLGLVHNLFKPIPGRFKDYIAIPKANGYQSLHTTLFGLHGIPVEIQIRTQQMEDMANNGIAAHWLYKSGDEALIGSRSRTHSWLQNLLELQQTAGNSLEFIENVKVDLFPDEVYVFTPRGDILELPRGATPVDFAYAVHTDIGNTCVACRIDRKLASLSQPLNSGETVEVITAPGARPNAAWLNYVITSKARSTIRHFLKNQRQAESVALGRRLLNKVLISLGSSLDTISSNSLDAVLAHSGYVQLDELLEDIGLGNRMAYVIARRLMDIQLMEPDQLDSTPEKPLTIKGTEGMIISFARCCYPIPGDLIVGHVSSGRGLVIHNQNCSNISEIRHSPEKILEVDWDKNVQGEFLVELNLTVDQKKGMIAALATAMSAAGANIDKIAVDEHGTHQSKAVVQMRVRNRVHLADVIRRLRVVKGVYNISRDKKES